MAVFSGGIGARRLRRRGRRGQQPCACARPHYCQHPGRRCARAKQPGTVTGGGIIASGQSATLTATPNSKFLFVRWTEDGNEVSTKPRYTFTANADRQLVAHFIYDVNGIWTGTVTSGATPTSFTTMMHNGDFISEVGELFYAGTYAVREAGDKLEWVVQGAKLYQTGTSDETANLTATIAIPMESGETEMTGTFTTSSGTSGSLSLEYADGLHGQLSRIDKLAGQHDIDSDSLIAGGMGALEFPIDDVEVLADGSFTATGTDGGTTCSVSGNITLLNSIFRKR